MNFLYQDKNLEKLLKNIESLISKMTRFNIISPCVLQFGLDKTKMEIFPILSHNFLPNENIKDFMKQNHLIDEFNTNNYISEEEIDKHIEKFDQLSIVHYVLFSTNELDLSLTRNDLYIYSNPIEVYLINKLKEFLELRLIKSINFHYDETMNKLEYKIDLFDIENPITQRQKKIYLSETDQNGYLLENRNKWLGEGIINLCNIQGDKNNKYHGINYIKKIFTKDEQEQDELTFEKENDKILVSKEFIKAAIKYGEVYYYIEGMDGMNIIYVLNHVVYNNNINQYIFYRYYDF